MNSIFPQSKKNTVRRGKLRAAYDVGKVYGILDKSFLCHVGVVIDGVARVLPTAYVRVDNAIYLHGHLKNKMMQALMDGQTACITVTLLDGLVLARSAFHHSVNYRSATLFGKGEKIEGEKKKEALHAFMEHIVPGRHALLRPDDRKELNATLVVKFEIEEASAKIRTGPPVDADKDYDLPIWAGVANLKTVLGSIDECPGLSDNVDVPEHIAQMPIYR